MTSKQHSSMEVKPSTKGITLLGLGPGDPTLLTRGAWEWLGAIKKLYLRTKHHPTVAHLPAHLDVESFDELYKGAESFEMVYAAIVDEIIKLGGATGVTYAVPGHPFVAEATCPEIVKQAEAAGIPVQVIDGMSFLEPTFRALGLDPFPNLVLMDAIEVMQWETPGFPPSSPALIAQIYDRDVAAEVKLTLMSAYPDEHPVKLVHAAGTGEALVEELPLHQVDKSSHLGLLSSLFIAPLSPQASFEAFQEVIARLRAPDGCPWDREQTHLSLRPFLLEEAYEALDALDRGDLDDLAEELGDLLLQILLHAQVASEAGDFNIHHVIEGIASKLIRRHPHVFSEVDVAGVAGVIRNWEQIKAEERQSHDTPEKNGLLDGVPAALPALSQAEQIIERVGRVGFPHLAAMGKPEKIREMLSAFDEETCENKEKTLGKLLLGLTVLAHQAGVDAESALRQTLARFRMRFGQIENAVLESGQVLIDLPKEEMDRLWQATRGIGHTEESE